MTVGVPSEYFPESLDEGIKRLCERALDHLRELGANVKEVSLPHTSLAIPVYYIIAPAEASSNLARFDGVRYGLRVTSGDGLRSMYDATRSEGFGPEVTRRILLGTYVLSAGYYDAYYKKAQEVRALITRDFSNVFADGVDVLFTPTTPTTAFPIGAISDPYEMYLSDIFTATANLAGIPGDVDADRSIQRSSGRRADHGRSFRRAEDVSRCLRAGAGARRGGAPMSADAYEMVVGLEVHVQLKTRTKAFCGCSTDFGAPPNVNTCPVCLALPGALPVLNEQAVTLATRAAVALGCTVHPASVFARKNYFYPDLPKGYQISQYDRPLATGGHLAIQTADGGEKRIGITRLHMEEDAGKSIHDRYPGATAIDLNRAGRAVDRDRERARHALGGGSGRVSSHSPPDSPVSRRQRRQHGGGKSSRRRQRQRSPEGRFTARHEDRSEEHELVFRRRARPVVRVRAAVRAARAEARKSRSRPCSGMPRKGEARISRTKEGSHDYRYFPEPDLRPLILDRGWISQIEANIPELPAARKKRFAAEYQIGTEDIEQITAHPDLADYFETSPAHRATERPRQTG